MIFAASPNALADPAIGKVVAVRGRVVAFGPDKKERPLVLKAPVFLHDTVQTRQGRVQLMFEDHTLMTLGRNTHMEISAYSWKPGDKNSAMETRISEGSFRIMGGAITRTAPENFKTHAPSGTIGIRGSMYAGLVKKKSMTILFQGGKGIYVKNQAGMVDIKRPGFGTLVKGPDLPPQPPEKMSAETLMELEATLAAVRPEEPETNESAPTGPDEPATAGSDAQVTDSFSEPVPESTAEASTLSGPSDGFSDPVALPGDELTDFNQGVLNTSLEATGTEQKIQLLMVTLGYSGDLTRSTNVPSDGIGSYSGKRQSLTGDGSDSAMKFVVNWHNQRVMGFEDFNVGTTKHSTGFGFGSVTATGGITNLKVLGSDNQDNNAVTALSGSETFGQFYGTSQAGLGLAMEGDDVEIQNQTTLHAWSDIAAATYQGSSTASTGTENWEGFYVGVAEDMAAPNTNRRVFTNNGSGDFTMTIDKDAGTVSGVMSGEDFNDPSNTITTMTIGGGTSDSVYIDNHTIAATLSGSNVLTINYTSGGLKTYGNFMVTSRKAALSSYTTWGYWEAAYSDPYEAKDYHIHVPGSLWIAGELTPSTEIDAHISSSFTGHYEGSAQGVMFDSSSQMTQLTGGQTDLDIDFSAGAGTPVSGSISFDGGISLIVTSGTDVTNTGFIATISGASASSVEGGFYGQGTEAAKAVAGRFSAKMPDDTRYHGIFGGDRVGPIP